MIHQCLVDKLLDKDEKTSIFRLLNFFTILDNSEWYNCFPLNIPQLTPLLNTWKGLGFWGVGAGFSLCLMEIWAHKQNLHRGYTVIQMKSEAQRNFSIFTEFNVWARVRSVTGYSCYTSRHASTNIKLWSVLLLARSSHYATVCITEHLIMVFWLEPAFSFQPSSKVTE